MDSSVEVRYAGVVVGRGTLKLGDGAPADAASGNAFINVPEPLPVGTLLTLKLGDAVREARVEDVVESPDPAVAGMRVSWGGAARPAPNVTSAPGHEPAASANGGSTEADSGPTPDTEAAEDGSGAISAPLGLAGDGNGAQVGGAKKRRKRR